MRPRTLGTLLAAYFVALWVTGVLLAQHVALSEPTVRLVVRSFWKDGRRVDRQTIDEPGATWAKRADGAVAVDEVAVGEGPIAMGKTFFPFGLVPGRDGVSAAIDGKIAYATVDDLLSAEAYDHAGTFFDPGFGVGTHRATVLHVLASQLDVTAHDLERRGRFRRIRFERRSTEPAAPRVTADAITPELVRDRIREAAHYLARAVDANGRFRYLVDAPTDTDVPGYNWPRHSGATFFLAQAAAVLDDAEVRWAALRAASLLRDGTMQACGPNRCIAEEDQASVGSNALALVAFSEIVRTGADPGYAFAVSDLAAFLRAQQRADGELMHLYDRTAQKPVDIQLMYFTGEAALALSRAHRITGDPRDLDASRRALAHLSGQGWSFFGSRYYFGEEHWTCQAAADLWDRAPDAAALGFCLRWHEYQRRLQHVQGDSPFDADGAFGFGPIASPRVTPASSRGEAAGAALDVLLREKRRDEAAPLDEELRRAVAFVLRHQMVPGSAPWAGHLFAKPELVRGAFPGSPVDWQLRIDYVQHAGSMLVRWLEITERERAHRGT